MIKMRALRAGNFAEGDLILGDPFAVAYTHERTDGELQPVAPIPWMNAESRALEFQRKGIATLIDGDDPFQPVPEVVQSAQPITIRKPPATQPAAEEPELTEPVIKRKKKNRG